jgi:hypothetical protein
VINVFFISSYGINTHVIHLLMLFEHWYHVHCVDTNVICLFISFKHKCCMSICVFYTRKSYTRLLCLNNARHSCLTNTNIWNNKFCMDLEQTHEACKFVMKIPLLVVICGSINFLIWIKVEVEHRSCLLKNLENLLEYWNSKVHIYNT